MNSFHPDEVLAELKAKFGTNKRAHRNLDALHKVCREVCASDKVYSIAAIGRRLQAKKALKESVPAANSLRSARGQHFRDLIQAWAEYDGVQAVKPKVLPATDDQQLLASIPNNVTRERIGMKLAELKRLRTEINDLKAVTKMPIDMRRIVKNDQPQVISAPDTLTDTERSALAALLDQEWLKSRGWKEGSHASIVWSAHGKPPGPILLPGTLSAIRKLTTNYKVATQV